jgi:hypothetical protein
MTTKTALSDAAQAGPKVGRVRKGILYLLGASGLEVTELQQMTAREGRGFIPSINGLGHGPLPLAQTYPRKPLPLSVQRRRFLIANARLKFRLSDRKRGLLKISNRERIAVFCVGFSATPTGKGKRVRKQRGRDGGQEWATVLQSMVGTGRSACATGSGGAPEKTI